MSPSRPATPPSNPLGDPRGFRGMRTNIRRDSMGEKTADFVPGVGSSFGGFFVEVMKTVVIALAVIIVVRYFILQPFYVQGASMEPNFHDNEYLIIDELSYRLHTPQRGDVIVLRNPHLPSEFFIKRVIGLPNDRIVINDGTITLYNPAHPNGATLDEHAYLPPTTPTLGMIDEKLGPDEYYVLGDNRTASLDSRIFGPIKRTSIIGRTAVRAWPFQKFTTFHTPIERYLTP